MTFFFIFLFFLLSLFIRKDNLVYTTLILLIFITFFFQFLVGRTLEYKSYKTIFNVGFICINVFIIVKPWSHAHILKVENVNINYFVFFKKILYQFLLLNLLLNLLILVLVLLYLPNIAEFKSESAYLKLYDQIPYFANIFRFAYLTQYAGYLAIPIFYYHLGNLEKKKAFYALLLSNSSLLSGFAFYSRAQIFTYSLIFILYFFLIKKTLPIFIQVKVLKFAKLTVFGIIFLFLTLTYVRFSAMDYYGNRIPEVSIIKDPILYSLFDYASQSYSNGLNQLDLYTEDKNLKGEQFFRDIYQILNFFGVLNWDVKESQALIDQAYDNDGGAFNGYTTPLVFNFGYVLTLLISSFYFITTKFFLKNRSVISLKSMGFLILLLIIPTVSIFYTGYGFFLFPLVLIGVCSLIFSTKLLLRKRIVL